MDKVFELVKKEAKRQNETLQMIPSENYASTNVRKAMGSIFENKYAEGYPGKRYYQGNIVVDELERLCQDRAKKLFGVPHVNVQPLSGAPANLAIIKGLRDSEKDIQLSQILAMGGHLSMGQEVSVTSHVMKAVHYGLTADGEINWKELEELAIKHKPKIIWAGGTAYTRIFQWQKYADIANKVGAYFVADISHIGGLVAGGAHPSPVPYAHIVMTTTHKTLRGPRGAMILVTDRGLKKDPELAKKIDSAVFPGVQGGPHMETIASLAVALAEADGIAFKKYSAQIVKNAQEIAKYLKNKNYNLVGDGTSNHMVWIDLTNKNIDGWAAAWALEYAGIIANRQTVPNEKKSPYYPSGLRLGTPAITSRGMKEPQMRQIAKWIDEVIVYTSSKIKNVDMTQEERKMFKLNMIKDKKLLEIAKEVKTLCKKYDI
ncbi:MAG: serine hydroxymethyltransferase [Candidatus Amesbacteria bacterium]|nr:serine hydroxymethyltransferase [Candidatus Amesbacteria bacterium]